MNELVWPRAVYWSRVYGRERSADEMLEEMLEGESVGDEGTERGVPGRRAGVGMAILGDDALLLSVGEKTWPVGYVCVV